MSVTPPLKSNLYQMVLDAAKLKNLNLGFDEDHLPDIKWLVIALATLNPNHNLFSKSYKPQVRHQTNNAHLMVDNSDGFFDNLPQLQGAKSKGKIMSCLPKEKLLELQMLREQEKSDKALARI